MKNKKILIIAGLLLVLAGGASYVALRDPESNHMVTEVNTATGQRIYKNLDYGFSIAYGKEWEGPAETKADNVKGADPLLINAVFRSTSTLEAIVIAGKPGDKESFNEAAAVLDIPYTVVTIGGLPSLRYEYVAPINEEGTAYAKIVMFVFKGLPQGSVTMAYQKLFTSEKEAKKADMSRMNEFFNRVTFN
jgi:hypothetical protein